MASREITRFGLSRGIVDRIVEVCARYEEVERVILYGSRATGRFYSGSDIDLAIDAPKMDFSRYACLSGDLDNEPILFRFDLHHLQTLDERVRRKVERDGVVLYDRKAAAVEVS